VSVFFSVAHPARRELQPSAVDAAIIFFVLSAARERRGFPLKTRKYTKLVDLPAR